MNLKEFQFPELSKPEMVFSVLNADKTLLQEAKERGFYHGRTPYNRLFAQVFYSGGKVLFKKDVDKEWQLKVWNYCYALMKSWSPKHEEKEAICALLMSEIVEPEIEKAPHQ